MKNLQINLVPVTKIRIVDGAEWVVATLEETKKDGINGGVLHVSIQNVPTMATYFESIGSDRTLEQFIISCNTSYLINKILLNGLEKNIGDFSPKKFARSFLKKHREEIKAYCRRGQKERERFKRLCSMHSYHILDEQDYEGVDSWGSFGIDRDAGIKEAVEAILGYSFNSYQVDEFLQNEWQWDTVSNPKYEWVEKHIDLLKKGLKQHIGGAI